MARSASAVTSTSGSGPASGSGSPSGSGAAGRPAAPAALAARMRVVLVRVSRQLRRQDPPGPSIAFFSALATICAHDGISVGDLAEAERLPPSAATRLADRLEEASLVQRRRSRTDRRQVHLAATAAGRRVLSQHRRQGNAWLARRLKELSASQRRVLVEALGILETLVADDDGGDRPGPPVATRGAP